MVDVRAKERLWTAILVGFAVLYIVTSLRMEQRSLPGVPSAASVPVGLGIFLLALLGLVIIQGTRSPVITDSHPTPTPSEQPKDTALRRAEIVLALAVAYAFALGWVGFPIATTCYMLLSMYYLKPQRVRLVTVGLWAVAVTTVFWVVFVYALKLQLPGGRLWG